MLIVSIFIIKQDEEILEKSPYDTDCVNHTELWEKNGRSGPRSQNVSLTIFLYFQLENG